MRRLRSVSFLTSGLPLFLAAVFSFVSCKGEEESPVIIFAKSSTGDKVAPGGHVLYDVTAKSRDGNIVSVSLTEMSDETGLKLIEERQTTGKEVKERFDYHAHETQKDTSIFLILFEARDDLGRSQEFKRSLKVIRPKPSEGDGGETGGEDGGEDGTNGGSEEKKE